MHASLCTDVEVRNTSIQYCHARMGGGAFLRDCLQAAASFACEECRLNWNEASISGGGIAVVSRGDSLSVANRTSADAVFINASFVSNTATSGGAIHHDGSDSSVTFGPAVLFQENEALEWGGAIEVTAAHIIESVRDGERGLLQSLTDHADLDSWRCFHGQHGGVWRQCIIGAVERCQYQCELLRRVFRGWSFQYGGI